MCAFPGDGQAQLDAQNFADCRVRKKGLVWRIGTNRHELVQDATQSWWRSATQMCRGLWKWPDTTENDSSINADETLRTRGRDVRKVKHGNGETDPRRMRISRKCNRQGTPGAARDADTDRDAETQRRRETQRHRDTETQRHRDTETGIDIGIDIDIDIDIFM